MLVKIHTYTVCVKVCQCMRERAAPSSRRWRRQDFDGGGGKLQNKDALKNLKNNRRNSFFVSFTFFFHYTKGTHLQRTHCFDLNLTGIIRYTEQNIADESLET